MNKVKKIHVRGVNQETGEVVLVKKFKRLSKTYEIPVELSDTFEQLLKLTRLEIFQAMELLEPLLEDPKTAEFAQWGLDQLQRRWKRVEKKKIPGKYPPPNKSKNGI